MCFLKTLKSLDTIPFEKRLQTVETSSQESIENFKENSKFYNNFQVSPTPSFTKKQDQLLLNLIALVNSNTVMLQHVDQRISFNNYELSKSIEDINSMLLSSIPSTSFSEPTRFINEENIIPEEQYKSEPLIQKLFGKKKYQYKLQLAQEVPNTIYKERNINISVNLKNCQNQKILNSNIIHLCLGVCDSQGQWINENKMKQNFMKGKTEIQMYHGEGSFLKIYPREVSRCYLGGKINFIIYPKSSLLKFTSNSNVLEKIVDSELIEPLLIQDISIKAKKKD